MSLKRRTTTYSIAAVVMAIAVILVSTAYVGSEVSTSSSSAGANLLSSPPTAHAIHAYALQPRLLLSRPPQPPGAADRV